MDYIDEKIEKFLNIVIKEAVDKKNKQIKQLQEQKQHAVEVQELSVLDKMYHSIQNEMGDIVNQKNERIAKAITENKNRLLLMREDAVNTIMGDVLIKTRQYLTTTQYKTDLNQKIKKAIALLGDGEIVIMVREQDKDMIDGGNFAIQTTKEDIIGGFSACNRSKKMLIDETMKKKLEEQKQFLYEMKELQID